MAASSANYKRILGLIERWPVDKNKTGRDLGEYLKSYFYEAYNENTFEANQKFWDRQYLALNRLLNNEHLTKYPRSLSSSATGLTAEECNIALSNEVLEELQKEEQSMFKKLFSLKSSKDT